MNDYTLKYNLSINNIAHYPFTNSFIGAYRFSVNFYAFLSHTILAIYYKTLYENETEFFNNYGLAVVDLKQMIRGIIELPPVIGGVFSFLWDHRFLTPAQQLAYRIQNIYQTKMGKFTNYDKTNLKVLTAEELKNMSQELQDFVNGNEVMISTDESKINNFINNFKKENYDDAIFNDSQLPFVALAAFAKKEIDVMDISTVLEIYMTKMCFDDCKVHPLLDKNGDWSQEAKLQFLEPIKTDRGFTPPLYTENEFKASLAKLPPHKRLFYSYTPPIEPLKILNMSDIDRIELSNSPVGSLYANLVNIGFQRVNVLHNKDIILSFDAERIFLNRKYNKSNVPFTPKLGQFTTRDIKKEVCEHNARLVATFFPGVKGYDTIHNSLELPPIIVQHDIAHAHIMQKYPQEIVNLLVELAKEFETVTGEAMSKEIWKLIDMVIVNLLKNTLNFNDNNSLIRYFLNVIQNSDSAKLGDQTWQKLLFNDQNHFTLFGWVAVDYITRKYPKALPYKNTFNPQDEPILKYWKLMQSKLELPIDKSVKASDLEFKRIKSNDARNNTITIVKK